MRRNFDLIRTIALKVEESSESPLGWIELEIEGVSDEELSYHIMLMDEAGILIGQDLSASELCWRPKRLTWAGHEFVEAARDEKVWKQALTKVGGTLSGVSFQVLVQVLTSLALGALGLAA